MIETKTEETMGSALWPVQSGSEADYWSAYESMRPKYGDDGFLENAYSYHASKSNSFEVAHDIACGYGKATVEIAQRFKRVIASDANPASVGSLRKRVGADMNNIEYAVSTAESLAEHFPPGSADFITAAQTFPILDPVAALSSMAQVLKPNGTLAIWFYGRPHFSESEYMAKCQPILNSIMGRTFGKVIKGGTPKDKATWKKAADSMASWLDNIEFPPGQWSRVERRRWNSSIATMGFAPGAVDFDVEPLSNVRDGEQVLSIEDAAMWARDWSIDGVKNYIDYAYPGIQSAVGADEEIQRLFGELAEAMGGEHAIRHLTWPITLVLATRSDG